MTCTRIKLPRSVNLPTVTNALMILCAVCSLLLPSPVTGRLPSEMYSCTLTSVLIVLSSPSPMPIITALFPILLIFKRNSMLLWRCLYRKA